MEGECMQVSTSLTAQVLTYLFTSLIKFTKFTLILAFVISANQLRSSLCINLYQCFRYSVNNDLIQTVISLIDVGVLPIQKLLFGIHHLTSSNNHGEIPTSLPQASDKGKTRQCQSLLSPRLILGYDQVGHLDIRLLSR